MLKKIIALVLILNFKVNATYDKVEGALFGGGVGTAAGLGVAAAIGESVAISSTATGLLIAAGPAGWAIAGSCALFGAFVGFGEGKKNEERAAARRKYEQMMREEKAKHEALLREYESIRNDHLKKMNLLNKMVEELDKVNASLKEKYDELVNLRMMLESSVLECPVKNIKLVEEARTLLVEEIKKDQGLRNRYEKFIEESGTKAHELKKQSLTKDTDIHKIKENIRRLS